MNDINDLYQQLILDHNRNPRNFGDIEVYTNEAVGHNTICGDKFTIKLVVKDEVIKDIKFAGVGCAISQASASLMTEIVKDKSINDVKKIIDDFQGLITGKLEPKDAMGKLAVFAGVSKFPARTKCASLAWHTLKDALTQK